MANDNPIGKKLLEIRTRRGETQEAVAEAVGISYVSMSRYETGQRMPKMDILCKLADHYNVTVDEIMGRAVVSTEDWNPDDMDYADKEDETIKIMTRGMKRMSAERRQKLLEMVRLVFSEDFDEEGHKRNET